jgi:zinc transport system substrate-binding protein
MTKEGENDLGNNSSICRSVKTMKGSNKDRLLIFVLAVLMISFVLTLSCGRKSKVDQEGRMAVVVTIPPLADFVENVGKDRVEVSVMVPPGVSPHTYEPTPSQLKKVSQAKIYVKVGSGVEFELTWMDKLVGINKDMAVINGSQGIEMIEKDPHVWLSPLNAKTMVENICNGLIKIDPENGEFFVQNKNQYLQELDELDRYIREKLEGIENKRFLVYHPSWGYFAKEYGLKQIPIEHAGKEPTAKEIKDVVEKAKRYNIKVVFVSPQLSTKSAEVIAKEIGGQTKLIDPLAQSYIPNMRIVIEKLTQAMR